MSSGISEIPGYIAEFGAAGVAIVVMVLFFKYMAGQRQLETKMWTSALDRSSETVRAALETNNNHLKSNSELMKQVLALNTKLHESHAEVHQALKNHD